VMSTDLPGKKECALLMPTSYSTATNTADGQDENV
jgi:hypothetical protein